MAYQDPSKEATTPAGGDVPTWFCHHHHHHHPPVQLHHSPFFFPLFT